MEWLPMALAGERVVVRSPAVGDESALVEMATDVQVRRYIGGLADQDTAEARARSTLPPGSWRVAQPWPANEGLGRSPISYALRGGGKA
jgi:hypothetical protein